MHKPRSFEGGFTYEQDSIFDGAIPDGLWKNYKSDFNVFADMDYGYGYMRGPWNLNPNPYVSRYTFNFSMYQMPSCSDHYTLMTYDSLMSFFNFGEFAPHGNVHIITGGAYGCDMFRPLLEKGFILDEYSLQKLCVSWSAVIMKTAYRYHMVTPEKNCKVHSKDINLSQCKYQCDESAKDDIFAFISSLASNRDDPGFLNLDVKRDGAKEVWLEFICGGNGGKVTVTYIHAYTCIQVYIHIHYYIHRYMQMHAYIHVQYMHIYIHMHACTYKHAYKYTYIYITHTYIQACIHIQVYIHIHIYIHTYLFIL